MEPIVFQIDNCILEKMTKFYGDNIIRRDVSHTFFVAKVDDCTITVYKSMKAMFQGKNAHQEALIWKTDLPSPESLPLDLELSDAQTYTKSHLGSDEVGTGDYFGPICVVACYVTEDDSKWLLNLGIQDSKDLNDRQIIDIARQIKDKLTYSLLILDNEKYNDFIKNGINQANIKARLHNLAILNACRKVEEDIELKVVDQFVASKTYFNYLKSETLVMKDIRFETKAENKYLAVACASILARYAFLQSMSRLSKEVNTVLPKGAGSQVDLAASKLVLKYGDKILDHIAKVHFSNTNRVMDLVNNN